MYSDIYNTWLSNTQDNIELHNELIGINNNENEIEDRFYKDLDFGTAGLRGVLGAGTNRMNIYTVGKATQGLAEFLLNQCDQTPKVAIAYDSRKNSLVFAEHAASVLGANGIRVYLYDTLMPTPMLSYAVRELNCDSGIVITASHNPSQYNGYKVYGRYGYQITDDDACAITNYIKKIDIWSGVKFTDLSSLLKNKTVVYIEQSLINKYYEEIYKCKITKEDFNNLKLVYSPLNGTGNIPVRTVLNHYNIGELHVVHEQEEPDENFTTCPYPNPENTDALELGLKLCKDTKADFLLATDPDCDRCGIAVRHDNDYIVLTGNQVGVLLLYFICNAKKDKISNGIVVKSIVSTELARSIADFYHLRMMDVLVGFKYIGEIITNLEKEKKANEFVFGFEESCGYLSGIHARDKDAVNASLIICDMISYYKRQGKDLIDILNEIYERFGYYLEIVENYQFGGSEGEKRIKKMIDLLNSKTTVEIDGLNTLFTENYSKGIRIENEMESKLDLPISNVIRYRLQDGSTITVRPSGTEPKIKLYYSVKDNSKQSAELKYKKFKEYMTNLLDLE